MNEPPNVRIEVPEAVVVQTRLWVMPLPLETDGLVGGLAPDAGVVDRFWCFQRQFGFLQLPPSLYATRVVRDPLGQVV